VDEAKLFALLKTTGLPVAYHHFVSPPSPPYIVYLVDNGEGRGSDERNEIKQTGYIVELYTAKKDLASQAKIETLFDERGIDYTFYETFLESEGLYQGAYHIESTIKIRRN
jgi:hypothetical protein